jgi:hypothetical protein
MSRTDDRREHTLPVTAEVGGEGGSFADPTIQVATFENDLRRGGGPAAESPGVTQAGQIDDAAGGDATGPGPDEGLIRHPSEDPSQPPK